MIRNTASRFVKHGLRRTYSSQPSNEQTMKAAHNLAEEALAQKTGGASQQFKATLPKGDKKPAKAAGEKENHWKSIAIGSGAVTGALIGGLFYYGRPFPDERENKYASENILIASYHRSVDRFRQFRQEMHQPMWDKLLPDPLPEPYRRPYTLVINLDETLVYSTWTKEHGWRHAKRPGVDYFLSYLSQFYEIVIFTSQPAMNAMPILDKLDPYQYAMYRLYRDGTRYVDGQYIKDLSHLNRDLSKVIIMDSNPQAFSMQPENGVALKPWKGQANDHGLLDYIPFLEAVALTNPEDIRPVLKSFGDSSIPEEWAKREAAMNEQHRQQWLAEQKSKPAQRNLGSLLRGGGGATESQGPPPTYLEQMRQHVRQTFAQEHEQMKVQQDQMMKDMEMQKEKMKEMKMTVWELMAQVSSGQPLMPPGQEVPQQQQHEQPSQ
ncbi:HAD-like domain-containing protein [Halteromyces radiatus]|uniref:HAD-like domain-containing protein n=1 Tax=Halteromyces radiatus TaxID=101107 RepID=UPI00222081D4|nr:HAD-like domain-containing protein [Halteromyces radiatus]KAI8089748.1 HAD-like domain-containing protein [Halteromyces radiatus]